MELVIAYNFHWHNLEALSIVSVHEENGEDIKSQFSELQMAGIGQVMLILRAYMRSGVENTDIYLKKLLFMWKFWWDQ